MIRPISLLLGLSLALPAVADPAAPRSNADAARVAAVTALPADPGRVEPYEARPAGAGTVMDGRFSAPLVTLGEGAALDFVLGEAIFDKLWVPAPTATRASDGLGPLFNARACANCHPGDARGGPPEAPGALSGMVLKLSRAAPASAIPAHLAAIPGWQAKLPDPQLGTQLQDRAIPGVAPEGALSIDWEETQVSLSGGEVVSLRRPLANVTPALASEVMTSLRVGPQLIGLGLLEAVPEADILAGADPEDKDGDGISGRASLVWSADRGQAMLGRFGLKAGAATLREMAAAAFSTDMGLSSPLFPDPSGDCTADQIACRVAPNGEDAGLRDGREVGGDALDLVARYLQGLSVPARRAPEDAQVLQGKDAFHEVGCPACHRPKYVTARLADDPARSFQLIWPYTDLLLHDMGSGLADGRPEGVATGAEWRTAPLWGIALNAEVSGKPTTYLHDGRARSLLEAILWHGGEAQAARDRVARMAPDTRAALIRYLESL
ncbi:thiol oxidoreductase [Sinirhodobacter sp. WL0062]|uniref:Thiol oxidoreductase n=1 Tax=Rhodobacter flavimaris TaxID=2907145 RepID=A0ABS8YX43_9RHOB|nr:di-heme oxidoredictase family protein [Sinirhodobacter sp. WL0062]MCE5974382.1 thiol oxidoreductase [Sinirhodobacter sp. WL0062]